MLLSALKEVEACLQCEISPYYAPEKSRGTQTQDSAGRRDTPVVPSDATSGRAHLGKAGLCRGRRRGDSLPGLVPALRWGESQRLAPSHSRRVTHLHGR